jgi:hypothetical protein
LKIVSSTDFFFEASRAIGSDLEDSISSAGKELARGDRAHLALSFRRQSTG